ncbi:hypothetical protein [Actinomadura madurae]|nr:hypothetical protein [Actinomadura madurae]
MTSWVAVREVVSADDAVRDAVGIGEVAGSGEAVTGGSLRW